MTATLTATPEGCTCVWSVVLDDGDIGRGFDDA